MSFRARLTVATALAVAVAVLAACLTAYAAARSELRGQVDDALLEQADRVANSPFPAQELGFGRGWGQFPRPPRASLGGPTGYVQLVAADGRTSRPPDAEAALPVDARVRSVAEGDARGYLSDHEVERTHMRVLTVPLAEGVALQLARPLDEVDTALARLRLMLAAAALGGVGLAVALGLAVSRAAVGPVRRLSATSAEIARTRDLARRVEVTGRDELAVLASTFNTMLAALEDAQRTQRQLVADASHELRTPLTSVRTNLELLGRGGLPPEEQQAAMRSATVQLEELSGLVADLVELAREGSLDESVEDVRLDEVVEEAVERVRLRAPQVRFETRLAETVVRGSSGRLHRAVANLLDNAVKWSPPAGVVEVEVADGRVSVRDHGPGIAEEDLPHVFDRFYRAPAARGTPGFGLGLAIVRQVAEAHGGSAQAEPAEGGGTRMTLRVA
jgi:two-component system sensor histidine kinase MprB